MVLDSSSREEPRLRQLETLWPESGVRTPMIETCSNFITLWFEGLDYMLPV